ncbi:MATH and LRR domain-containing protein PFE0570w-like [Acyrthosiphon pisum]|uniref:Uncharacterized protein n=1 Tax=Acyrthosiphon pisum TaxID=7029 RepID=A0A8R2H7H2_ACYPI|nr:MATH and LRR domain-containing protein PFE0570w-like [Acyrthosiphon pisum]|eukprot:XP_016659367.1 PREDICTED: MATH and LRR domain-containing protein PFE0570w-like [Acyrthosiphon pisum]
MNQQFSVLGLFFSILILAENLTTVLNNVLQSKPTNTENNHSTIEMKTTFLNKKFIKLDRTKNLNVLNSILLNNIEPVSFFVNSSQINRFPRQVANKNNNEDEYKRHIKVILDLKPDNYEDMYDYFDSGKYNDNREKKIKGLIDELNLHREIEENSRPITRNLNESQERKRCTKTITQNLDSKNHQQSQKLLSTNIEDRIKPTLKCRDCELLKSNINLGEPKNNYNSNQQLEQMVDNDHFIKVLNQLIDKINKPKNVKSTLIKELPIQKSIEPTMLENRFGENSHTNSSSSDEMIVKFEKIKGNRIINKLESSPENTFVNGNWVRNKIIENKVNDCKPIENDRRSGLNDKNESISKNGIQQLNLKDSKNQVIETDDNVSNKLKDLSVVTAKENTYISTSPLPEENEHLLFSRQTIEPFVVSSTSTDKTDSSMIDENYKLKFTTKAYTDQFNKEDNISSYNENNKNQDKQFEPSINNFPTMAEIFESTEELKSDLNETSKLQNPDGIAESNDNNPNSNYSTGDTIVEENQNNSLDDNMNCNCNKKIIKNILRSTVVTNITEIKTDMDTSPSNLKMNSHKRSNQLLKKNGEINISKNKNNEDNLIKNKKDLNSDFLGEKQATFESTSKNNLKESNSNLFQGSVLNIDGNHSRGTKDSKTNKNEESDSNNSSFSSIIPELKLKSQIKRNNDENINKVNEINNKRLSLIHKNLPQINTRQFVAKLKRLPQNDDTSVRNDNRENNNMDKITENNNMDKITESNNIFTKSSAQKLNKIISRTPLKTIPEISSKKIENITKKSPGHLVEKKKLNIPINSKLYTTSNSGDYDNTNYMTRTKKIFASPRILSQVPIKNINKHSPQTTLRNLEKLIENDDDSAIQNIPRKFITGSDKYTSFNPNTHIVQNLKENNIYKKNISRKDSINTNNLDPVKLQRPLSLLKSIESTKIQMTPKNKIVNNYSTKIPTYSKNNNIMIHKNVTKTKISKPAIFTQSPKKISSSDTTKQMKNNENMSILKLNIAKTKPSLVPLFPEKIAKTKYNLFDKPLTSSLKNKNILNDQSPMERIFNKKTDTIHNLKSKYDAESNDLLKSYPPEKSQVEDLYDHEHAPYTKEYLEPILFRESSEKANISNKNNQFVIQSPISRQSSNRNRKDNKLDVQLSQPVPVNRPEQDENHDDTKKNNKVEVNVKKQKNQPYLNTLNDVPINSDTLNNDKYDVWNPNDESTNQNKFGVLSQVKIADGVFKIPLVSQTSVDNNGSEYVSEIFIPIEKPDGRHSAISLTKLLTGDFKLLNEPGVENLSIIQPKPEIDSSDSTLGSTRTSTDCESSDITDYSVNPNPTKILETIKDDKKLSAPIHIIQIINNGQCPYKHNGTDTVKKSVRDDDERKFRKFRNEGRRLSSVRSQNTPNNNKQIDRKIGDAYNHFDSGILDRFLQVYSPHLV